MIRALLAPKMRMIIEAGAMADAGRIYVQVVAERENRFAIAGVKGKLPPQFLRQPDVVGVECAKVSLLA